MKKPIEVLKEQGERSKIELPEAPRIQVLPPHLMRELARTVKIMQEGEELGLLEEDQVSQLRKYEVMLESGKF